MMMMMMMIMIVDECEFGLGSGTGSERNFIFVASTFGRLLVSCSVLSGARSGNRGYLLGVFTI